MKLVCTLAVAVTALTMTAAPQARSYSHRSLSDAHVGSSRPELVAQRDFSLSVIRRVQHSWRFAPRHRSCWSHVPWSRVCDHARRTVTAHRWLYGVASRRLASMPTPLDPALVSAFTCIHHYEGAWNDDTGNGYFGGLQMDLPFQSRYGSEYVSRWGTADRWPPWAQLSAAIRAYRAGRGFGPWPNTARACGLL